MYVLSRSSRSCVQGVMQRLKSATSVSHMCKGSGGVAWTQLRAVEQQQQQQHVHTQAAARWHRTRSCWAASMSHQHVSASSSKVCSYHSSCVAQAVDGGVGASSSGRQVMAGVDGTPGGDIAFEVALDILREGDHLHLLYVPPEMGEFTRWECSLALSSAEWFRAS